MNVAPCALQPTNKPVEWGREEEGLLVKLLYVVWEWLRICGTAVNNFYVAVKKKEASSKMTVSNWVSQHNKNRHINK